MDHVLRGLDFTFCYLDDILVTSSNEQEHEQHLEILLKRLQDHGLTINMSKCIFGVKEIPFLRYTVSSQGIKPHSERVQALS